MKIAVWDTYVKKNDGKLMHFDILVPEDQSNEQIVYNFGNDYLLKKKVNAVKLSAKECQYCHMENASEAIVEEIQLKGYYIIEMENCN
ncbi:DUF2024 family protein [Ulvibacter antarcticus]|uniref:Uncharacterized protein DUF2024 n=1 Tax=Ulvibacter antarcticus TaxID=442714 RepID=A0A3L9YE77_9FLAO|nr:DUF2024 family protein [Ulvibacter antarcticus]RMA58684.1 uncharacterized protein DUF2024 [Ulvibacter antarcticus]